MRFASGSGWYAHQSSRHHQGRPSMVDSNNWRARNGQRVVVGRRVRTRRTCCVRNQGHRLMGVYMQAVVLHHTLYIFISCLLSVSLPAPFFSCLLRPPSVVSAPLLLPSSPPVCSTRRPPQTVIPRKKGSLGRLALDCRATHIL